MCRKQKYSGDLSWAVSTILNSQYFISHSKTINKNSTPFAQPRAIEASELVFPIPGSPSKQEEEVQEKEHDHF